MTQGVLTHGTPRRRCVNVTSISLGATPLEGSR